MRRACSKILADAKCWVRAGDFARPPSGKKPIGLQLVNVDALFRGLRAGLLQIAKMATPSKSQIQSFRVLREH